MWDPKRSSVAFLPHSGHFEHANDTQTHTNALPLVYLGAFAQVRVSGRGHIVAWVGVCKFRIAPRATYRRGLSWGLDPTRRNWVFSRKVDSYFSVCVKDKFFSFCGPVISLSRPKKSVTTTENQRFAQFAKFIWVNHLTLEPCLS